MAFLHGADTVELRGGLRGKPAIIGCFQEPIKSSSTGKLRTPILIQKFGAYKVVDADSPMI